MLVNFDDFPQVIRVEIEKIETTNQLIMKVTEKLMVGRDHMVVFVFFLSVYICQLALTSPKKKEKSLPSLSLYVLYTGRYIHTNLRGSLSMATNLPCHLP